MKSPRVPSYRKHSSGQARVTLDSKDRLLGPYGSPESREAYRRAVAEWLQRKEACAPAPTKAPLTVNELLLAYWQWAAGYYGFGKEKRVGTESCLRAALHVVKDLYGSTPAADFGPLALKACRACMLAKDWSRTYINDQVDRVRRMFRWAAEEELLPASAYQNLRAVAALRYGKTEARETAKVRPVPPERVAATLPLLGPTVQAMVRFQALTGCRPAEVCALRPVDLDKTDPRCWAYCPGSDQGPHGQHKTAHLGHERVILVGPRAQDVLRLYLDRKPDAHCFSPAAAEAERNAHRREERRTPLWPSHGEGQARRRTAKRRRAPGARYDVTSYRNAVYRACDRAFPPPAPLARRDGETRRGWQARLTAEQREELRKWQRDHRWHPNQLRHSRATELRPYGLDVVKTILGHSKLETSQVYAEKDLAAAMELVAKVG